MPATTQTTNGAPITGAPACPKCGGRMWDNRIGKRNPKAPNFKCRDRSCDGVIWPPKGTKSEKPEPAKAESEETGAEAPRGGLVAVAPTLAELLLS